MRQKNWERYGKFEGNGQVNDYQENEKMFRPLKGNRAFQKNV